MGRVLLRRGAQGVLTLLVLATFVFGLTRATGNPASLMAGPNASSEEIEELAERLGFNRPIYVQYLDYLGDLIRGDFGTSLRYGRPTIELYASRLPNTLILSGSAMAIAIAVAMPMGVIAGVRRSGTADRVSRLIAIIGVSMPDFWLGLVLIRFFSVEVGWFPAGRMQGASSLVLPAITLSTFALAGMTRLLRSSMIETMDSEYVKFGRLKGVPEMTVVWKHALRNAVIPVLSFAGIYIALMLGGAIVVETVFTWPGVGRLAFEGLTQRDFPLVQAVVLLSGAIVVTVTLLVDVLYAVVDPRIRFG